MKKIIGFIGTYIFYYIGHFFSKISYFRIKNTFVFDIKGLRWLGAIFCWLYMRPMISSMKIQDWANLDSPWIKK